MSWKQVAAVAALAAIPLGLAGCSSSDSGKASAAAAGGQAKGGAPQQQGKISLPGGNGTKLCAMVIAADKAAKASGDVDSDETESPDKQRAEIAEVVAAAPGELADAIRTMVPFWQAEIKDDDAAERQEEASPKYQAAEKQYETWIGKHCVHKQ